MHARARTHAHTNTHTHTHTNTHTHTLVSQIPSLVAIKENKHITQKQQKRLNVLQKQHTYNMLTHWYHFDIKTNITLCISSICTIAAPPVVSSIWERMLVPCYVAPCGQPQRNVTGDIPHIRRPTYYGTGTYLAEEARAEILMQIGDQNVDVKSIVNPSSIDGILHQSMHVLPLHWPIAWHKSYQPTSCSV